MVKIVHLLAVSAGYFMHTAYSKTACDLLHAAIGVARSYDPKAAHYLLANLATPIRCIWACLSLP